MCRVLVVVLALLAVPMASLRVAAAVPTVEIAPNVFMPLILDGVSNRSLWIDAGGRGLDTALTYGTRDQQNVGDAIKASGLPRSAFFVVSKVPCCLARKFPFGPAMECTAGPTGTRNTTADAEATLAAIGIEYVDLLLLHWPCDDFSKTVRPAPRVYRDLAARCRYSISSRRPRPLEHRKRMSCFELQFHQFDCVLSPRWLPTV